MRRRAGGRDVLDSKIQRLKDHFGITRPDDWCAVDPSWITVHPGVGPATLNMIRIWLAARGLTLRGDRTAEYWQANLDAAKIGQSMGDDDVSPVTPFTILIDSAETIPYQFLGIKSSAATDRRPWIVKTEWRALGRHPDSLGDYSIDGFVGRVAVERKSLEDCQSTILGWDGRRERFKRELANLAKMDAACVVVEAGVMAVIRYAPAFGKKTAGENAQILAQSIMAWQQDYRVPWFFADGYDNHGEHDPVAARRLAELFTFRFLERFFRKHSEAGKQTAKLLDAI
jgi:hypothetical protein